MTGIYCYGQTIPCFGDKSFSLVWTGVDGLGFVYFHILFYPA